MSGGLSTIRLPRIGPSPLPLSLKGRGVLAMLCDAPRGLKPAARGGGLQWAA